MVKQDLCKGGSLRYIWLFKWVFVFDDLRRQLLFFQKFLLFVLEFVLYVQGEVLFYSGLIKADENMYSSI